MALEWRGEGLEACAHDTTGRCIVTVDPAFYRPNETRPKVGDASQAKQKLGWAPSVDFEAMIELMVEADLTDVRRGA
jgi:GDPmannose 4,6-dehydratase